MMLWCYYVLFPIMETNNIKIEWYICRSSRNLSQSKSLSCVPYIHTNSLPCVASVNLSIIEFIFCYCSLWNVIGSESFFEREQKTQKSLLLWLRNKNVMPINGRLRSESTQILHISLSLSHTYSSMERLKRIADASWIVQFLLFDIANEKKINKPHDHTIIKHIQRAIYFYTRGNQKRSTICRSAPDT